jgi:TPP-dependent trihydroxycyclohexane-1,2-dione (THcHDO) dehydratase
VELGGAVEVLAAAKRPIIVIGGGAVSGNASAEILALAHSHAEAEADPGVRAEWASVQSA